MIQIPNNNYNVGPFTKTHIIIHGTAGGTTAVGIANFFKSTENGNNPVSSHYIIGQDGTIVQCVQEKDGAWANGSPEWNNKAISIEHVKSTPDNSAQLTPIQQATSFALIKVIMQNNPLINRANILPHSAVYATACPGPYPWQELITFLMNNIPTPPSQTQIQAAKTAWATFFTAVNLPVPRYTSGIALWWQSEYYQGRFHGPPVTNEYHTVDWGGVGIIAQDFTGGTVTWFNGTAHWYPVK